MLQVRRTFVHHVVPFLTAQALVAAGLVAWVLLWTR